MNLKSKQFKQLQKTWYSKLKETGFEDIESTPNDSETPTIKHWHSLWFKARQFDDIQEYFTLAEHFLNEYQFQSIYHKKLWQLHSIGLSLREISLELVKENLSPTAKSHIQRTLKPLIEQMLVKYNVHK